MPPRIRLVFSGLGLIFFLTAAVPLYRELSRRSDIWWTPYAMLVPLAALLQEGQLGIAEKGASSTLAASEIGLRFNNWDRVRAERLPLLLTYAAACGVTACMFLLALTGRLAYRGERGRKGSQGDTTPLL